MDGYNSSGNYEFSPSIQGYYNAEYYGNNDAQVYQGKSQLVGSTYHDGNVYQPTYNADNGLNSGPYYQPQQQYDYGQESWDQQSGSLSWNQAPEQVKDGSYYFNTEFAPQISGYPVSALAYNSAYEAMYIASNTQSLSSKRWRGHCASMLVTHSTLDGVLYSSVAGHPEASSQTLQSVYECIFGIRKTIPAPPDRHNIPPHAYKPSFGGTDLEPTVTMPTGVKRGHIGISSILPLHGYAATISPSAVRIHAHGGLQLHDLDIEGMLCGAIHPHSGGGEATHISVGGIALGQTSHGSQVHCVDLWQGLRIVSSRTFKDTYDKNVGVTTMACSHERSAIVAGCSDGNIRMLDSSLREVATVKSHAGGLSSMATSADGMLIATTGYSSRAKVNEAASLYAFSDPTVYLYDIRYLGRGGIPHPFAGVGGIPHHLAFVPDIDGFASNRLLVASGKPGGGLQILVPFEAQNEKSISFFQPGLEQGEFISAIAQSEDNLGLGTNLGRVLCYKLAGYEAVKTKPVSSPSGFYRNSQNNMTTSEAISNLKSPKKKPLKMPNFLPANPPMSLSPSLLAGRSDPGRRNGNNERVKSIFSTYVLQADPKLTSIGNCVEDSMATFGTIATTPIVLHSRRKVADSFLSETAPGESDYLLTVPTSKLGLDLLANHNKISKRYRGKKVNDVKPNPNKFLYCNKLSSVCYEDGLNGKRRPKLPKSNSSGESGEAIPPRYRLKLRPSFKTAGAFDPSEYNDSGLFPGWDYAPTMPNAFASPVLLLLYFVPEILSATLSAQYDEKLFSPKAYEKALTPELGFVFDQIESLCKSGLIQPIKSTSDPLKPRLGAWHPSNFLTALTSMPEAEQLQILDGSPAAVDHPRRPEAFYRFLAYQLDRELSKNSNTKLVDSLQGLNFISINQFISGSSPASKSTTRALTVDLFYDTFRTDGGEKGIRFGEVLQRSLCRETRLRAWNHTSKAYETIVQRKIATSLPKILGLSCACAGRKNEDGLCVWRTDDGKSPWLPEYVEVEIGTDGNVIVREMIGSGSESSWVEFSGKSALPAAISELVAEVSSPMKHRYRLDAVVSYVVDGSAEAAVDDEHPGHHVLHARVPHQYRTRIIANQKIEAERRASMELDSTKLVITADVDPDVFKKRSERAGKLLTACSGDDSEWVLYNGFLVAKTVVEDARAFHVEFKEPCLVVFRSVDETGSDTVTGKDHSFESPSIPVQVMNARSLGVNTNKAVSSFNSDTICAGKMIAFDAEFVSVQEEEASIAESGAKVVIRETRHAIGRISVIDCDTREVILDDHVLPRERVVDYLTRFSGIVAEDLDPTKSPHNLISSRSAYLKLRYLMEQGCIFVGHGLRQDFMTLNLIVPPHQILDTVEIFHQPGMRYMSLRFLSNYVLGRDMQQDIHDSVEDAMASFELYEKALEWKREGIFEKRLQEIYAFGQKTDWKFAVEKS